MKKIKLSQKSLQTIVSRVIKESQLLTEILNACAECIRKKHAGLIKDETKDPDCIKCVETLSGDMVAHNPRGVADGIDMIAENRGLINEIECEGCGTSCTDGAAKLLWDCLYVKACACDIIIARCEANPECNSNIRPSDDDRMMMEPETMEVSESELIDSIERIVKEQTAVLGFGNFGNLGIGTPTSKYQELGEDDETYNVILVSNVSLTDPDLVY